MIFKKPTILHHVHSMRWKTVQRHLKWYRHSISWGEEKIHSQDILGLVQKTCSTRFRNIKAFMFNPFLGCWGCHRVVPRQVDMLAWSLHIPFSPEGKCIRSHMIIALQSKCTTVEREPFWCALEPGPEWGDLTGCVRYTRQQKFGKVWFINTGIKINFWTRSFPIPGSLMPREECPRWLHAYGQKWALSEGSLNRIFSWTAVCISSFKQGRGVVRFVWFFGWVFWFGCWGLVFYFWLAVSSIFWPLTACDFIRHE